MRNRKVIIRRSAAITVLAVLSMITLAFFADGNRSSGNGEAVETVYGSAIYGGRFSWLDNVKRPGITASVGPGGLLGFDIDPDNSLVDRIIDPTKGLQAAIQSSLPLGGLGGGFRGPFDNQRGNPSLVKIEQVYVGPVPINYGGGSGNGGSFAVADIREIIEPTDESEEEPGGEDGDGPVVVPVPGAAVLAAIGLIATPIFRRKRK